jgi:hypothetical protein
MTVPTMNPQVQLGEAVRKIRVCVPIYFDAGIYPSAGIYAERRNIYWRTIAVLCASIRRLNVPELEMVVCTNEAPSPDILDKLNEFGASLIAPQFSFQPPAGLFPAFSGAFYLFDCMNYCRRVFSHDEIFIFIDPDCLVMKTIEVIRQYSRQWSIIGYDLKLENDEKMNGCSRNDLLVFLRSMKNNNIIDPPKYFGGEFLVVAGEALPNLCKTIETVWETNNSSFQFGRFFLKTEEHVISAALALSAASVGSANAILKRMWTRPSFRNVSPADREFLIWHLPAEKRYALQRLFYLIELDLGNLVKLIDSEFEDVAARLIRMDPSFVEKIWYLLYPLIKVSVQLPRRLSSPP